MRLIDVIKAIEFPDVDLVDYFRSNKGISIPFKIKIVNDYPSSIRELLFVRHKIRSQLVDVFENNICVKIPLNASCLLINSSKTIVGYDQGVNELFLFDIKEIKEQDESYLVLKYGKILLKEVGLV